ncbi:MipA/OmpV family protein [Scleromatobacter humisilvae]|uniref:MipA/OmpV family protein n=1 Tax=Scleromatobacter humisilvae TaxID=2897159 RepID=A0A9X2BXC2_9BURK|nr:MipA/OmpV family protein [Scleromatobacter humisilvae]MCK9684423.1 MipA/OmpV family protein [Scleromatobacter humisilvae]
MKTRSPRVLVAAAIALACCAARADSSFNMPEGSHDISFAATAVDAPRSEGGERREVALLPSLSGRWSNGIVASPGQVLWDVSDDPVFDYGPLLTYGLRPLRTDDPSDKIRLDIEGGVFATFLFDQHVRFNSELTYGGGADRSGVRLVANANFSMKLGAHGFLTLSPGFEAVNASYMKSSFGITPAQSGSDHLAPYVTHPGLKNVFFNIAAGTQLSNKWSLASGVNTSVLLGSAAHTPLTQRRTDETIFLQLGYHY